MGYEWPRTASRAARRGRSRYRRLLPAIGFAALVLAFAWASGLIRFAAAIPSTVVDTETRTDAIVVLTGGSERLATGVSLLARGLAQRVFVSGVHPDVDAGEMLKAVGEGRAELIGRIDAGHGARDTAGNASETAAWLQDHGYRSLRLVTASYHMPRSLLEFSRALPDATIVPHPVFPGHVMRRWWLWPGSAALIIGEYHKFLWSWLRLEVVHIAQAPLRPADGMPA
jgi:uncharacterized SAM-binding protein YcdF (DUF218 family)